ncbi:MAG TPA: hypothetical protein DCW60_01015 [Sutterella sp.]|nr:hypothetical protein [Sutterella sp.]
MLILGATFMVISFCVFSVMATIAGIIASKIRTPAVQKITNRLSAVIFLTLALSTLLWSAS